MQHRLYYSPGACSLAVHIMLEEAGVPFELVRISVADGSTAKPEYLAINPKARVPALAIPGETRVLTELPAILAHVARLGAERGIFVPCEPSRQARIDEWLAWLSGSVHGNGFAMLWRPARFSATEACHPGIRDQGRTVVIESFRSIEDQLDSGANYALGGEFSVVDAFLVVLYRWGNRIALGMGGDYPKWSALSDRIMERPATARAFAREGVSINDPPL